MSSLLPAPDFCIDIFLNPGEFYFGGSETRLRTLLGSCVAITMWHPRLKIGGMCHYMLPTRKDHYDGHEPPDGRYADEAIVLFLRELNSSGTQPSGYEVKMFGGGDQFPDQARSKLSSVPANNIDSGRKLLNKHGFTIKAEHLGGAGHRNVIFEVWSGDVWIRHAAKYQEQD
jgi:chemotaxis protein CheD